MAKSIIKKVTVAINGSDQSEKAAMYAIMLSCQMGSRLKVVSVVDTATIKQLMFAKILIQEESEKYLNALRNECKTNLEHIKELALSKGLNIDTEIREGAVWSQLITASDEYESDLLVIGGRKHSATGAHDHLSAINAEILANANCNVFVVRETDIDRKFKIF